MTLMLQTRPLVEPYWLVMLSYLPETLDPVIFADILPEFVSKPSLRLGNTKHVTSVGNISFHNV